MKLYKYNRFPPSLVSLIFFLCFLYIIFLLHRNCFFFFPFQTYLEKPDTAMFEDMYFSNGIHGWYYFSSSVDNDDDDSPSPHPQQLIIFLNGNSGNISSRISIIKIIKKLFPQYDIFHMDYPGFGNSLSSHIPSFDDICKQSFRVYETIHTKKSYQKIGIWAEDIGCLVALSLLQHIHQSSVDSTNSFQTPDWYLFHEGMFDLSTVYRDWIPSLFQILILPILSKQTNIHHYDQQIRMLPKVCILHSKHNRIFSLHQVMILFLNMIITKPEQYRLVCLEGNEQNSIFLAENQEKIYSCIQNFL